MRPAPGTFATTRDADDRLAEKQTEIDKDDWRDPDARAVNFAEYAVQWVEEHDLEETTDELYRRLLRLHLLPAFEAADPDENTPPRVPTRRAERLKATGSTTVAKPYRLRARKAAGLPEGFTFYGLRHTGHRLSTQSGATLWGTMVPAGQSRRRP